MLKLSRKREEGVSLVDAILGMTVMGVGVVSFLFLFSQMTRHTINDESRLRGMHLAREKIEQTIASKAVSGYAGIANGTTVENFNFGNTPFTRTTIINWVNSADFKTVSGVDTGYKRVDVNTSWGAGANSNIQVMSLISSY